MSRHSPSMTRKPSCSDSRWYSVVGFPGSWTWTRTPIWERSGTSIVRFPNFSFTHHSLSATLRTNQSGTPDPRAEELVRPHWLAARLAVDDRQRRKRRVARGATSAKLAATLRAGGRHVGLELLEPAARRATTETECDPVTEDLPTLLPQPIRRFGHVLTIAAVVAVVAGCGDAAAYTSTRGARVNRFTLH